jgi:hypothetical protein
MLDKCKGTEKGKKNAAKDDNDIEKDNFPERFQIMIIR